jgi:hypothetical protein
MSQVSKNWKDSLIQAGFAMSEKTTVSDEAYAVMICEQNLQGWIYKIQNDNSKKKVAYKRSSSSSLDNADDDDAKIDHETSKDITEGAVEKADPDKRLFDRYWFLFKDIKFRRMDRLEGKSWDNGFRQFMKQSLSVESASTTSSIQSIRSANKKFSPEKSNVEIENW